MRRLLATMCTDPQRSTDDYFFYGGLIQIGEDWYSLATHHNGTDYITSDVHTWRFVHPQPGSGLEQPFYMGPGLCHNPVNRSGPTHGDGRLYVRLDNSSAQAQSNPIFAVPYEVKAAPNTSIVIYDTGTYYPTVRFPGRKKTANTSALENPFHMGPTDTITVYLNPGTYDIRIGCGPVTSFTLHPDPSEPPPRPVTQITDPDPRNHALYIARGDYYGLNVTGSHLVFEDFAAINHFYGCYGMTGGAGQTDLTFKNCGGRPLYVGAFCGSTSHLKLDSCKVYGHMNSEKWWVAWGDVKSGCTPADHVRKCAFGLGEASEVEIVDCFLDEFFDGILTQAAHHVEVHRTTFNHIWDDAWQMFATLHHINYHDNYHYGAGPSVDSSGTGSANPDPGTVYIHHNIVDTTKRLLYWARWGRSETGLLEPIALSAHGQIKQYTWPRKLYYNTIVTGAFTGNGYVAWSLLGATAPHSQTPQEVYNNVLHVLDGRPGGRDFYAHTGREIYDGNVYWHWRNGSPSGYRSPWRIVHTSTGRIQDESLQTVTQLRASQAFLDSQIYYPPGWEASGLSVDPQLDVNYKPQNPACHTGAVDLTAKGWPGTATYEPWRGALDPS